MKLKDFLGKEYGPGDLVIYGAMSGRSVNVVVGRVVDIYLVYRDEDKYKWTRLEEGQDPPPKKYGKYEGQPEETCVRVKVQPLRAARWQQHHGRKRYIDTRSGKGIDPDAPSRKHILKEAHYVFADGREYDYEAEKAKWDAQQPHWGARPFDYYGFRKRYHVNYGAVGTHREHTAESELAKEQLWWVSRTYQPWVQRVDNGPEPVTLEITDNIVKWEGELPDEVPVQVP